jgi:DNA-binding transcriptional MerR regulator
MPAFKHFETMRDRDNSDVVTLHDEGERGDARVRMQLDTRLSGIGEVSREFGLTLRALRFYEDKGLIAPLRQGVTRLYRPEDRRRIALILKGKRLGFTLQRIRALIDAPAEFVDPETQRPEIVRALSQAEVTSQLETLERQRADLDLAIAELRATATRMSAAA